MVQPPFFSGHGYLILATRQCNWRTRNRDEGTSRVFPALEPVGDDAQSLNASPSSARVNPDMKREIKYINRPGTFDCPLQVSKVRWMWRESWAKGRSLHLIFLWLAALWSPMAMIEILTGLKNCRPKSKMRWFTCCSKRTKEHGES